MNDQWSKKPLEEKLSEVKNWTIELPPLFINHILTIRDNAIQAFNDYKHGEGYRHALKAVLKAPLNITFLKDVLYHTKKGLIKRQEND